MTEIQLIALGFNGKNVAAEVSGYKNDWYYYEMDLGNGRNLSLVSSANDEVEDDEWVVEIVGDNTVLFKDSLDVMTLIDLINKNTRI